MKSQDTLLILAALCRTLNCEPEGLRQAAKDTVSASASRATALVTAESLVSPMPCCCGKSDGRTGRCNRCSTLDAIGLAK